MAAREFNVILGAILLFTIVGSFGFALAGNYAMVVEAFVFAIIILVIVVGAQKGAAYLLDADATHSWWSVSWFGLQAHQHFKKPVLTGVFVPLLFSVLTLGLVKIPTFLTYETRALKTRAAKRFGYYSFTEMTDWHNGVIGAAGIFAALFISLIAYISGYEYLMKLAAYYAFFNMIPISNLDGAQIFFGSRILWATLAFLTIVFTAFAFVIPL